ncbi:MAG: Bug family tripartite tricarboxylate transporter substrate binding protein [Ramlibacter sp.]
MKNATANRRHAIAAIAALCLGAPPSYAQSWPDKPIRLVVPSPPGGGTDALSRLISAKLTELVKWQFVVDNKAGAGGNLGMDLAAKSAPDGYTIVMGESSNLTINPYLYSKLPFDPVKDVTPVALVGAVPLVLVVASHRPYNSLPSLIVASRIAYSQGKQLVFASSGNGTVGHLVGETWQRTTGAHWLHVPYKGAGPVMTALLGDQVDMHFASLPAAMPLIKAGKLRVLAVTSAKRLASMPEVPTLVESGAPDMVFHVMYGLMAPAGTPKPIVATLNVEVNRALQMPDLKASLAERGVDPRPGTPEQFGAFLAAERAKWSKAVKASGAKVD